MKKSLTDTIRSVLKRGPRRGLTAEVVAQRAGTKLSSTRTTLSALVSAGEAAIVGTESRQYRPANLYADRSKAATS